MENVGILIVADNPSTAQNLAKLIQFENDLKVVGIVHTAMDALFAVEENHPNVILMDVTLPDQDGYTTTAQLHKNDPLLQTILLSFGVEAHDFRKAMKAGATDLLMMPVGGDMLTNAIREAAIKGEKKKIHTGRLVPPPDFVIPNARPQGKLITIYSGKGGVGCTLIAVNLALALHSEETPCVLVDAALQYGDVTTVLNLQSHFTIADIPMRSEELELEVIQEVLLTHSSGLRILSAPSRPELADEIQAEGFRQILKTLKNVFAYIVVDTASYLGDIVLAALEDSEQIISVIEPDIPSVKNTRYFLNTLAEIGIPHEKVLLVLNQVNRRDRIRSENVSQYLHYEVKVEIPFDRETVKLSINRGEALLTDGKPHLLTKPMLDLVRKVRERLMAVVEG